MLNIWPVRIVRGMRLYGVKPSVSRLMGLVAMAKYLPFFGLLKGFLNSFHYPFVNEGMASSGLGVVAAILPSVMGSVGLIVTVGLRYSVFLISTQNYSHHFFKWDICAD